MSADGLTILAERAIPAEEIVTSDAESQLRDAEAKNLAAEKQWAKARLSVAKSGKGI
jgi:F0F1-type ATP synthase epsilon subunit